MKLKTLHLALKDWFLLWVTLSVPILLEGQCIKPFSPQRSNGGDSVLVYLPDGKLLAGGGFSSVNGVPRNGLVRYNADGSVDLTYAPPSFVERRVVNNMTLEKPWVNALLPLSDGKVLVGGGYTHVNNVMRKGLNRLLDNGQLDLSFSTDLGNAPVILGIFPNHGDGRFYTTGTNLRPSTNAGTRNIVRHLEDGQVDNTFFADLNGLVKKVFVQADGKILVAGHFTAVANTPKRGLIRLNTNGSLDNTFTTTFNSYVEDFLVEPDGKIIVVGAFTQVSGLTRNHIARLNADGTVDNTFNPNTNGIIRTVVRRADGNLLIGGEFNTVDGQLRPKLALLTPSGDLDNTFNARISANSIRLIALKDNEISVVGGINRLGDSNSTGLARINTDACEPRVITQRPIANALAFTAGLGIRVPFTVVNFFDSTNVFTLQLSDINGSFDNPQAIRNLGTKATFLRDTIEGTIPPDVPSGFNYRIRVVAAAPRVNGAVFSEPISISSVQPSIRFLNRPAITQVSGSYDLRFNAIGQYQPNNVFRVLLSDAQGRFSANSPVVGSVAALDGIRTVSITIPANTPQGSRYVLKIMSLAPAVEAISDTFTINNCNDLKLSIITEPVRGNQLGSGSAVVEGGIAPFSYRWRSHLDTTTLGTTPVLNNLTEGRYRLTVVDARGCQASAVADIFRATIITTGRVPNVLQPGQNLTVPYLVSGRFDRNNAFTVELSDTAGRFDRPRAIGVKQDSISGNVLAIIPRDVLPGNRYRLRVVGNSPIVIGSLNDGGDIRIGNTCNLVITGVVSHPILNQRNGMIIVTAAGGVLPLTMRWSNNVSGEVIADLNAGVYTVTVTDANNCTLSRSFELRGLAAEVSQLPANIRPGMQFALPFTTTGEFTPNNTFTAQLSDRNGSFINPVNIGTVNARHGGTLNVTIPPATANGTGYRIRIVSSAPSGNHLPSPAFAITATPTITTGSTPEEVNAGGRVMINFTATGNFEPGNLYQVQLSDADGSFANPRVIGTLQPTVLSGVFNGVVECTIPLNTSAGNGYRIRVISTRPAVVGGLNSNGAFSIRVIPCSPPTNIRAVDVTGSSITVLFDTIPGISNYQLEYNIPFSSNVPMRIAARGGRVILRNLRGATTYEIKLRTVCPGLTTSTFSNPITATTLVSANCNFTVVAQPLDSRVCPNTPARITATAVGNSTYTYRWSNGQTLPVLETTQAGTFTVTVTDANGCSRTARANVIHTSTPMRITLQPEFTETANGTIARSVNTRVDGGTAPYRFFWSNGRTTQNLNNTPAGSYELTVTDARGCSNKSSIILPARPLAHRLTVTPASDDALADGQVRFIAEDASQGLVFCRESLTNCREDGNFSNLGPGIYTFLVRDPQGNVLRKTVEVPGPLRLEVQVVQISGANASDGRITASASGGVRPYRFSLNAGALSNTSVFGNLPAGLHIVQVQDATERIITREVVLATRLNVTAAIDGVTGAGLTDGKLTLTITGGLQPYNIRLNDRPAVSNTSFFDLPEGPVTVVVTDGSGARFENTYFIPRRMDNPQVTAVAATSPTANNGTVSIRPIGGVAPFRFTLNNSAVQDSGLFRNLAPGQYTFVVTDATGERKTGTIIVGIGLEAQLAVTGVSGAGLRDGQLTITVAGGKAPFRFGVNDGPLQTSNTFNTLPEGTHTAVIVDGDGIRHTRPFVISRRITLTVAVQGVSGATANDGSINATTSGGVAPVRFALDNGQLQTLGQFNNLPAGTYTLIATDAAGNRTERRVTITRRLELRVISMGTTSDTARDGSFTIEPVGGLAPFRFALGNSLPQLNNRYENLRAGVYTVIVTDSAGNRAVKDVVIGRRLELRVETFGTTGPNNQDGTATLVVTGGRAPYRFAMTGRNEQVTNTFSPLATGTYTATVTDADGSTTTATFTITRRLEVTLAVTGTSGPNVNDGRLLVDVVGGTGPYTFAINDGQAQNNGNFGNLPAGTHILTVRDANGASVTRVFTVMRRLVLSVTTTGVTGTAANGTANLVAEGGIGPYTFSINNGTAAQNSGLFSNLAEGTYTAVVTDATGQTATRPFRIYRRLEATARAVNASGSTAADGSVTITASGGSGIYTYQNGNTPAQASNVFAGLRPGPYVFTVRDTSGNEFTLDVRVTGPLSLTVASRLGVSNVGAADGSVTLTAAGGLEPYRYRRNGATSDQFGPVFSNLAEGTHTFTVTDLNGNTATVSVQLTRRLTANLTVSGSTSPTAHDGSVTVNVTGGVAPFAYAINNQAPQPSPTFANLANGTYNVMVTDATGERLTLPVTITSRLAATFELKHTSGPTATDGSISVRPLGGQAPYTFAIGTNNPTTNNAFTSLGTGNYTITVRDAAGNVFTGTVIIAVRLTLSGTSLGVTSDTARDGSITVTANGGIPPYQFALNNQAFGASNTFNNLARNGYAITVRDASGQQTTIQLIVGLRLCDNMEFTVNAPQSLCRGNSAVLRVVNPRDTYSWSPSVGLNTTTGDSVIARPDVTTTYTIAARRGGCMLVRTVRVEVRDCRQSTDLNHFNMQVYPNPAHGTFNVQLNGVGSNAANITVTNLIGQLVYQTTANTNTTLRIEPETTWTPGIYVVRVELDGRQFSQKLIIH